MAVRIVKPVFKTQTGVPDRHYLESRIGKLPVITGSHLIISKLRAKAIASTRLFAPSLEYMFFK